MTPPSSHALRKLYREDLAFAEEQIQSRLHPEHVAAALGVTKGFLIRQLRQCREHGLGNIPRRSHG